MPIKPDDNAVRRFGHYEPTAREYCRRLEMDPEKLIQHGCAEFSDKGSGFYADVLVYTPQWLFVARDIWRFEERRKADQLMTDLLVSLPPNAVLQ